jgi:predicted Zn-dependent protease
MKKFLFLLLIFCFGPSSSQNLYTNEPDLVYPILEEFIAENFKNQTRSFEKINQIDTIMVVWMNYPLYGSHQRIGKSHTIKIHRWLILQPKRFERTLKHELGHVFGLRHIKSSYEDEAFLEFMSDVHYEEVEFYYRDPETWNKINHNYYQSLIPPK